MEFVIKPYESVGPLKLGMSKEELRSKMPEEPEISHNIRGPYTDFFNNSSLFAYYTEEDGICEAIEFSLPSVAVYERQSLNEVPFVKAMSWLKNYDGELEVEEFVGVTSFKLGIGLYAPNYDPEEDPNADVEAVIIFRKGYYD